MDRLKSILNEAHTSLSTEPRLAAIDWLATELGTSFDEAIADGCLKTFQSSCLDHPLSELLLTDPYSRRAFEKPRGYAGDAVMLDYIYRPARSSLDGLAGLIHEATTTLPNAKSILWRRDYLATLLGSLMRSREIAEVLSVASGHMRELDRLREITSDTNIIFTALDQDLSSISEARATYKEYNIFGENKNFTSLLKGRSIHKNYDLVYSAGLFDYLQDTTAVALMKAMFSRLKPGGVLSVANFTRDSHGRGFMAGFMDWCLIYRNEQDLQTLADAAFPKASYRIFRDQPRNVVYLEVFADRN
ncbi:class I SAM-dependent methyltransferase [Methylobacterium mesophilicum SR1.6/6]|uniref:Class I SAM-dependent methyltransferase n=1 Tax=Methylobacterium mesophilicum SR1.6/6 TaxID=908290 RepID=A0A6B9FYZ3_9HYPH|nr:class I SAM-dependent methyltransferase [Methylobacterium mesophilicum]QGY05514.1 class I SAM-dependent methyltransferase [Methylobacterium mesophilicum SR1.6/6]